MPGQFQDIQVPATSVDSFRDAQLANIWYAITGGNPNFSPVNDFEYVTLIGTLDVTFKILTFDLSTILSQFSAGDEILFEFKSLRTALVYSVTPGTVPLGLTYKFESTDVNIPFIITNSPVTSQFVGLFNSYTATERQVIGDPLSPNYAIFNPLNIPNMVKTVGTSDAFFTINSNGSSGAVVFLSPVTAPLMEVDLAYKKIN